MKTSMFRIPSKLFAAIACAAGLSLALLFAQTAANEAYASEMAAEGGAGVLTQSDSDDCPWSFSESTVVLSEYDEFEWVTLVGYDGREHEYLPYFSSYDENIVADGGVEEDEDGVVTVYFEKQGVGTTTVEIEDDEGNSNTITVICKPTPFVAALHYGIGDLSSSYTFSKATKDMNTLYIGAYRNGDKIDNVVTSARSSDPSVVKAVRYGSSTSGPPYCGAIPQKPGKAKVTIVDQFGQTASVDVTVDKSYFQPNLQYRTNAYAYYGQKKVTVYVGVPGAKVTVKAKGEKRVKKTDSRGNVEVKLKKPHKLNEKYSVTVKTANAKVTKKYKISSCTWAQSRGFSSCGRTMPITVFNVTKGDIVKISSGGESHVKKIRRTMKVYNGTFKFKKSMGKYGLFNLKVKNKYKQTLLSKSKGVCWSYGRGSLYFG